MNFKIAFIAAALFFITFMAQGQMATDTIQIRYHYSSKFFYQGKLQRPNQLLKIMETNPGAHKQMKRAISTRTFGDVVGGIGGFMVGYSLGNSLGQNKLNKNTLITGGVLVVISLPISLSYNKSSVKAVKMYNEGLRTSTISDGVMLELRTSEDGVGLKLSF